MDLDPEIVDYGSDDDEDPFRSAGTSSLKTDQSFMSSIVEETKREQAAPVYNKAGIDISEFVNQDYRKAVPFYRQSTRRTSVAAPSETPHAAIAPVTAF